MYSCINRITRYCVCNGIIQEKDEDWFRYGLEKRISTLCVAVPSVVLAVVLTDVVTTAFFLGGFFFLRSKTNGYHSKTILGCVVLSLIIELVFCTGVYPVINSYTQYPIYLICIVVVYKLAPYKHQNLPLTNNEFMAIRKQARIRVNALTLIGFSTGLLGWLNVSKGIILGMAMATFTLCLPYVLRKGGASDEQGKRKTEESVGNCCNSYD